MQWTGRAAGWSVRRPKVCAVACVGPLLVHGLHSAGGSCSAPCNAQNSQSSCTSSIGPPAVDSLRKQVAVLKGQLSRDRVLRSMQA